MSPVVSAGFLVPPDVQQDYGFQTGIAPASPPLGTPLSRVVPGAFFEVVLSVRTTFGTSAAAGNRTVRLDVYDGDLNKIASIAAPSTQGPGINQGYRWMTSLTAPFTSGNNDVNLPLFPFIMPSGWTLRLDANALQAGDTFFNNGLILQQYNTGVEPERFKDIAALSPNDLGFSPGAVSGVGAGSGGGLVSLTDSGTATPAAAPVTPYTVTPATLVQGPQDPNRGFTLQPSAPSGGDIGSGSSAGSGGATRL